LRIWACTVGVAFLALGLSQPAIAAKLEVLHEFTGPDGSDPTGGVIVDPDSGILYGTAIYGGAGYGTVYRLTPPEPGKRRWKFDVIYTFQGGSDGAYPEMGVALYSPPPGAILAGTTRTGSTLCTCGTLFTLQDTIEEGWKLETAHQFSGETFDGSIPNSTPVVVQAPHETTVDVFGTTGSVGGGALAGTIYRYNSGSQIFSVIYNPTQKIGGFVGYPPQGVAVDANEIVYGTAYYGAAQGTLFRFDDKGGKILHAFEAPPDGTNPQMPPTLAPDGTLYGTTTRGGKPDDCPNSPGCGTVWKKAPGAKLKILHSFRFYRRPRDGSVPLSRLVLDEATGTLYGTTYYGGTGTQCGGVNGSCGTIFSLDSFGDYQVLWEFPKGGPASPIGQLAFHDGALYGATYDGGKPCSDQHYIGCGTVWKLTP
jgi:uncharacterized repeat protein (TIGR03803 family)